jgi:hypothetical protein
MDMRGGCGDREDLKWICREVEAAGISSSKEHDGERLCPFWQGAISIARWS